MDIFLRNEIYFSTRLEFNDPFDCQAPISWDVTEDEIERRLIEICEEDQNHPHHKNAKAYVNQLRQRGEIRAALSGTGIKVEKLLFDKIGLFCLSANPDSILMWSHYADSHRGVCLEFSDRNTGFISDGGAHPVNYPESELYPMLKVTMHEKDLGMGLILTKSAGWKYEAEWRMLHDSGGIKLFPKQCLTGVIFGCNIVRETETLVREWCSMRTTPTTLFKAIKSTEKFKLEIEIIETIKPPVL